ncbi:putative tRNA methyltransferase 9B isoform 1-T1 [Vipera latastei]
MHTQSVVSCRMEHEAFQLEKQHVHEVYESTASYFNDLQGKAWPRVRQFLLEQKPGSLIADIGCGTGKYLDVNHLVYNLGCDYCGPLIEIARNKGCEVMICDNLHLPFRDLCFNAIISVGVIHHFSTKQRRIQAIQEMVRVLVPGGQMMIYVWAMEQKNRHFEKQDIFVPWNKALCSRLLSEPNKAGIASPVESQTMHSKPPVGSKCSHPGLLDQKHPLRLGNCLPGSCCVKMTEDEEKRFYGAFGRPFRSWFSSRSLDESALRKPNEKTEPLKDVAGWTSSAISIQPLRHCSVDLGCQSALLRERQLDHYDDVFTKCVACKEIQRLAASGSLRGFNGEPATLVQHHNGETSFLRGSVENIKNSCSHQSKSHSFAGKPFRRISSVGSSDLVVDSAVAVGDPTVNGQDPRAFMRYYHVFREGELCALLEENIPEVCIVSSSYDHGNWCIIVKKTISHG